MKAAFLIRCSTKKQDYKRQVNDLIRLAKQFGYEYREDLIFGEHITGKDDATVRDRESIYNLKAAGDKGLYDVILVAEVSRMSRDPTSGRWYVRQLTNMKIPVYFRDIETWSINPETGKVVPNAEQVIGAAFDAAWKYLKSMKTQVASGRRMELSNNCISVGQPFFGYKRFGGKDKETKNSWIIDELEAPIVREVYEEYLKPTSTLKSTALAITAKYGDILKRKFSIGSIEHILLFDSYATGIKKITLTDPDSKEKEEYEVAVPTIIPLELWEKATAKRQKNRVSTDPYPKQKTYVLSKLLKCPNCGYTMTPRRKGNMPDEIAEKGRYRVINGELALSWLCMAGVNNVTECNNRVSIDNAKIEPIIWELVKRELIYFANLNKEDRLQKVDELKEAIVSLKSHISNLERYKEGCKKRIEKAYKAYIDAPDEVVDIAKNTYYAETAKAKQDIAKTENDIDNAKEEIVNKESLIIYYSTPSLPEDTIAKAEADGAEKRKLVKELIEKIYPHKITTYKVKQRYTTELKTLRFGVVLLEVHTVNGVIYVFYNANERGKERTAYYINGVHATFQNGTVKFNAYSEGEYFVIPNANMVMETEELVEFASINQIVEIAENNNWVIKYSYE